jgi:hypothetical protein
MSNPLEIAIKMSTITVNGSAIATTLRGYEREESRNTCERKSDDKTIQTIKDTFASLFV